MVGVVADIVEKALGQAVADLATAYRDRSFDGLPALAAIEAGDKVFAFVDGFGQPSELGAVSEEVGAHGEHDVDGAVGLFAGFK